MSLFDGRRGLTKFNRWFTAPDAKLAKLRNESGKTIFSRQSEDALVEIASDACLLEQWKRRLIVADVLAVLEGVGDKVTRVASFTRSSIAAAEVNNATASNSTDGPPSIM
jgi:hypothetical protein